MLLIMHYNILQYNAATYEVSVEQNWHTVCVTCSILYNFLLNAAS